MVRISPQYVRVINSESRGYIPALSVSARHLKVHSVLYEDDEGNPIPPLVYVQDMSSNGTVLKKIGEKEPFQLVRSESPVLLNNGDILLLGDQTICIFRLLVLDGTSPQLTECQKVEAESFQDRYKITDQVLGFGSQGSVFVAVHFRSKRQLACKILPINPTLAADGLVEMCPEKLFELLKTLPGYQELDILKNLKHAFKKCFGAKPTCSYIFQDLFTGGDLFSYYESRNQMLQVTEAGLIIFQILNGVEYLHSRGVVHRDLKLENVLMTAPDPRFRIVLADFGYARYIPGVRQGRMHTLVGTLDYAAPEIFDKYKTSSGSSGYSKAVDMWAVGVISSILLLGRNPFMRAESDTDQSSGGTNVHAIAKRDIFEILNDAQHIDIGEKPKDFIKNLLIPEEANRMTASAAVLHSWFTDKSDIDYEALYQQAVKDWTHNSTSASLVEYIEPCEQLETSFHFLKTAEAIQSPRSASFDNNSQSSSIKQSKSQGEKTSVIRETPISKEVGLQTLELDYSFSSILDSSSVTAIEDERVKNVLRQDVRNMSIHWDIDEQPIPRPDIFDIPISDTDDIESLCEEPCFRVGTCKTLINSQTKSISKLRQLPARPKDSNIACQFRNLKPTKEVVSFMSRTGSGFEEHELLYGQKGHHQRKRVRWAK